MSRVVFMLHTEEDGSTDPTASVQSSDNPVSLSYSIFLMLKLKYSFTVKIFMD